MNAFFRPVLVKENEQGYVGAYSAAGVAFLVGAEDAAEGDD
jgi:hypothetical protein